MVQPANDHVSYAIAVRICEWRAQEYQHNNVRSDPKLFGVNEGNDWQDGIKCSIAEPRHMAKPEANAAMDTIMNPLDCITARRSRRESIKRGLFHQCPVLEIC
jgi:hypothetical protein